LAGAGETKNMKKILIAIAAVAMMAIIIPAAFATLPTIPAPTFCGCLCPGFTPGFWKHDLTVLLGGPGDYNAFEGGTLDGVKVTGAMLTTWLGAINSATGLSLTPEQALAILQLPGWSTDRTNLANWFNYEAGYGPY
jgi:hypothetical protein